MGRLNGCRPGRRFLLFTAGMLLAMFSGCKGAGNNDAIDSGKDLKPMGNNIYPVIYADSRRSSFINTTSATEGFIAWQKSINADPEIPFNPRAVLSAGQRLFVYSDEAITAFDKEGIKLWTKNIRLHSPVAINGNKVYYRKIEAEDELAAVTFSGESVEQIMWILASDDACTPLYIEPLEKSFLALCQCIAPPEQGAKEFVFYKKRYETESYIWVENLPGRPAAAPLHLTESESFVLFSEKEIVVYDAAADKNGNLKNRFDLPLDKILSAGADAKSCLYLLGVKEEKLGLFATDTDGNEKWNWIGGNVASDSIIKQPPIIGLDGLVHIPVGRTLISIKDGNIIREFTIEDRVIDYGTALADGSVLLTAGNTLYRVDAEGKKIYGLLFDDPFLTPPVVDNEGHVYIASAFELFRID